MNSRILKGTFLNLKIHVQVVPSKTLGKIPARDSLKRKEKKSYILSTCPSMTIFVFEICELAPSQGGFVNILRKRSPTPLNFSP